MDKGALTKGTRRSSFPVSAALNGIEHKQQLNRYTEIGYEIIAENGFTATLAYYPHSSNYVKIVTVENGRIKSGVQLTPKQLQVLSDRISKRKKVRA